MTDNESDNTGERPGSFGGDVFEESLGALTLNGVAEAATEAPFSGANVETLSNDLIVGGIDTEGNREEDSDDGMSIHVSEPQTPGILLVAVANPPDPCCEQLSSCEACDNGSEFSNTRDRAGCNKLGGTHGDIFSDEPSHVRAVDAVFELPQYGDLADIVAVRLGGLGPALFFLGNGIVCEAGNAVIVSLEEGQVFGIVSSVMRMNPQHVQTGDEGKIRPVMHIATDKDKTAAAESATLAAETLEYCRQCIRERDLDMKLVDVLVLHDRSKMVFYFTAPARIDFRELVKDLVRKYRTRIELRQIGVRHETQMVGALGNCGMVCCCRRYLRKFAPVAIKMAKEQNVFLNPVKISGICGRLLCCLAYEQQHYDEFYRSCPKLGKKYHTDAGVFRVLRASLFRESVTVLSETGEEVEYPLSEWNTLSPLRPNATQQQGHAARKQEAGRLGSDERPRKNDRNGQVGRPSRNEPGRPEADRNEPGREGSGRVKQSPQRQPSGDNEHAVNPPVVVAFEEETLTVVETGASTFIVASSEVAVVTPVSDDMAGRVDREVTDLDEAACDLAGHDVDYMNASDDEGIAESDDDDAGAGGSIFGLAPRRQDGATPDAGGIISPAHGEAQLPNSGRKKRPHRRRKARSES